LAQTLIGRLLIEMSLTEETKLLPDDRDSNTVWLNDSHDPGGMIPAAPRLMPNSANCPATRAVLLIGLFAAVMGLELTAPSLSAGSSSATSAPQHGGRSFETKQVPLVTHVSTLTKLGVHSRAQAVAFAHEQGLADVEGHALLRLLETG
jgi:hypothetical protein